MSSEPAAREPKHGRRIAVLTIVATVDPPPARHLRARPGAAARARQRTGSRAGPRQHRPDRRPDAGDLPDPGLRDLRPRRLPAARRRDRGGRGDSRQRARSDDLDRGDERDRLLARGLRHLGAARDRRRRRPGADAARRPEGTDAPGAGDRAAVAVHLSLPDLPRPRDLPARAAGEQADRVSRHLAGRDPLVLGLRPRRQGRREPGHRQHRLREDARAAELPDPVRRALRALARLHVRDRAGRQRRRVRQLDQGRAAGLRRRRTVHAARTARPTPRSRRGADERRDHAGAAAARAAPDRLQPAQRGDPRGRRLLPGLVARPPDQRQEHQLLRRDRPERHRALSRLHPRPDRPARRARLPQLPPVPDGRHGRPRSPTRTRITAPGRATSGSAPTTRSSGCST